MPTGDGSVTIYHRDLQEHYHSIYGAIQESRHVFIHAGLRYTAISPVKVFEMGFGTGLNALLTCLESLSNKRTIQYDGIDAYPLGEEVIRQLNYPELLDGDAKALFHTLHNSPWNETQTVSSLFTFTKIHNDLLNFTPVDEYDVIYFDAFNPAVQPELWDTAIFRKMFQGLNPGGILTTYSATGWVRRNMMEAGFEVEKLPGPPGKREMLRGRHPIR